MLKTAQKDNTAESKDKSGLSHNVDSKVNHSENSLWKKLLFSRDVVQTKLTVGSAGDTYEQQADAVAEATVSQNMLSNSTHFYPLKSGAGQVHKSSDSHKPLSKISPDVQSIIQSPGSGTPLNENVRTRVEPIVGSELSQVRVHTNGAAQRAARDINANAFTHKNDVFLGAGQSATDLRLMAHEVTHTLQQTAGMAHKSSTVVQRDESEEGPTVVNLTNARFSADRNLIRIARGEIDTLSARLNGRNGGVSKVQRALVDLGFDLPLHRVDGSYGAETETAIENFRSVFMSETGSQLDATAMIRLDEVAPAIGDRTEHNFDYERLFADGKLEIAVGFGHSGNNVLRINSDGTREELTEDTSELVVRRFKDWLGSKGFELALLGINSNEYWELSREFTYPKNDGSRETKQIKIWLHLITPGEGAARSFRQGLAQSEVTIYSGHARYGSGPDFDEKSSALENFRIGIDAAMQAAGRQTRYEHAKHHGVEMDEEHDLQEMVANGEFDPNRYRVLFFKACTSMAYLDEIRSELGGPENIDVVGSRVPTLFSRVESAANPTEIKMFLNGVLEMQTVEQIVDQLEQNQIGIHQSGGRRVPSRGIFTTSGIGDNPIVPSD